MVLHVSPLMVLLAAAPVAGQQPVSAPTATPAVAPSVESYLCTFAGKCTADTTAQPTRAAPETRGFRFARPTGAAPIAAPALQRPRRAEAAALTRSPRSAMTYGRAPARGYAPAVAAVPAPAAPRRADLMIEFELNSAQLTSSGTYVAQIFARSLLAPELRDKRFRIEGHTDLRGGRAINTALSAKRAQAVADYLVSQGVERSRLEARGYGSAAPLPGHAVSDPANRRVDAELIS